MALVYARHHRVVALVRLQGDLLERLDLRLPEGLDLAREDSFWCNGRVDTARLDRDDDVAAVFEEVFGIETDDTCLVGLGDIRENDVHCRQEHPIPLGGTCIFDDGYERDLVRKDGLEKG